MHELQAVWANRCASFSGKVCFLNFHIQHFLIHVALVHPGAVQFAHSHMSPHIETHRRSHQSIPQYSNLTPHLPLGDKTCIINRVERCQETSLIPIRPHSHSHACINNISPVAANYRSTTDLCSQWKWLQQESWVILQRCCRTLSSCQSLIIAPLAPFSSSVVLSNSRRKTRAAEGQ